MTTNNPTCQGCRHWKPISLPDYAIRGEGQYGKCQCIALQDDATGYPAILDSKCSYNPLPNISDNGDPILLTRHDFGCSLFEPNPEPR